MRDYIDSATIPIGSRAFCSKIWSSLDCRYKKGQWFLSHNTVRNKITLEGRIFFLPINELIYWRL